MQTLQDNALKAMIRLAEGSGEDKGQTLMEYGIIISFVALIAVAALALVGGKVPGLYSTAASKLHS